MVRLEKLREMLQRTSRKDWTEEEIESVWKKAHLIDREDPAKIRKDILGNRIQRDLYGKQEQEGWEIDHIIPHAQGGSNDLSNLQPLQWNANRKKSDTVL